MGSREAWGKGGGESGHAEESARSYPSKPNQYQRGGVCVCMGGGGGKFNPRVLFLSLRGWVEENTGNKVMAALTGILLLSVALTWNNISIVVVCSVSRRLVSAPLRGSKVSPQRRWKTLQTSGIVYV